MAGWADRSGLEPLKRRLFALIAQGDLLDLCRRLRDRCGVLGRVLLRAPLTQLLVQRLQALVDIGGVRSLGRILCQFLISGAQFRQLFLILCKIGGEALFLKLPDLGFQRRCRIEQPVSGFPRLALLRLGKILLPGKVDRGVLQLADLLTPLLEVGVGREDLLVLQRFLYAFAEHGQHRFVRDSRQIPFQQLPPVVPQLLDEVQGIEDGKEHVLFPEHLREVGLAYIMSVKGDNHAVVVPHAGEDVILFVFIHDIQGYRDLLAPVGIEAVDARLAEKRLARDGERDGVRHAGFASAVAARDDGRIAELRAYRLPIALKA